jgi:hypothetical protein
MQESVSYESEQHSKDILFLFEEDFFSFHGRNNLQILALQNVNFANTMVARSWVWVCRRSLAWDCWFESHRWHVCKFFETVVYCQVEFYETG